MARDSWISFGLFRARREDDDQVWCVKLKYAWQIIFFGFMITVASRSDVVAQGKELPKKIQVVLRSSCLECHNNDVHEAGLNLERLPWKLGSRSNRKSWIHVYDRIRKGEMPPADAARLGTAQREELLANLLEVLLRADRSDVITNGRGPVRRLTRSEYAANLGDLLKLPHLDIIDRLPQDRESRSYTKVAATLDMSRVQLSAYLEAADVALRQAVASSIEPFKATKFRAVGTDLFQPLTTYGGREAMFYTKKGRWLQVENKNRSLLGKDREVELALFRSATWPYYGYPRGFRAVRDGPYRVRFTARAVRQLPGFRIVPAHKSLTMTFRARQPSGPDVSGDVRETGGWIDVSPKSNEFETTVILKAGETFEYSLLGLPVPHPITSHGGPLYYDFPPMPEGGHRGVAFSSLEVTGPLASGEWPPPSHRILFDEFPLAVTNSRDTSAPEVVVENPKNDAEELFRRFAQQAAREPVEESYLQVYVKMIHAELDAGASFVEAMLKGYQAFLCSGHFLYLFDPTTAGEGSQFAIASRLSHLLWNSRPDSALRQLAREGELRDPDVLIAQSQRMIDDERFERFVKEFTDEWLDLRQLRRDLPDIRLYPEYRKDDYLVDSMHLETRMFFKAMVRDNLPVTTLVDADFTYVNDRLAAHYDLPPIQGGAMRRVAVPKTNPYGGVLTQASVLKVTSNGTTTSPVIRGAWVMEKLIGQPVPPPPSTVPAIEPDIRGATSIRELLAQHTNAPECSGCHARFDPVGFGLENFDIMGAWRDRYRALERGEKITGIDRAGHAFEFRIGHPVDASGTLRSGQEFADIKELKLLLAAKPRVLAKNMLHQFTLYATGSPVRFSDRPEIESVLDRCKPDGYRIRDLLVGLIQSPVVIGYQVEVDREIRTEASNQ